MSALKWNRWCSGAADCKVGLFCVTAYARATPRLVVSVMRDHGRECASLDETVDFAEAKLRDMLVDLQAHFAPVLRWEKTEHDYKRDASFGQWRLEATHRAWHVSLYETNADPLRISPASGTGESLVANQRAAEAALRSLGVAFRVEGE